MSRPLRFSYAGAMHHATLRCNNREFLFDEPAFELFTALLQEARAKLSILLYHYCLMTNHVHLLFEVGRAETLSRAMHWLGNTFSRRFNAGRRRRGHLWEGRFRSTIIESSSYFLRSMAYVDLNPVRAGMVAEPGDYRWSGHRALAAEDETVLAFHALYLGLGPDRESRSRAYAELLTAELCRPAVSLATEYFVGRRRFVCRMARRFGLAGPGAFTRRTELGGGVETLGPRVGGSVVRDDRSSWK